LESGRSETGPRFEAEGALATELEARRILKAELSKPYFERRTLWQTTLECSFTLCLLKIPHALKTLEFFVWPP